MFIRQKLLSSKFIRFNILIFLTRFFNVCKSIEWARLPLSETFYNTVLETMAKKIVILSPN